jgi:hypothetical protein
MEHLMQKLWKILSWSHIRAALDDIYNCKSYYVGGTLCIDLWQGYSVCLNRSGRGFAFIVENGSPELQFLMPTDVQEKVNQLYQEIKGTKND